MKETLFRLRAYRLPCGGELSVEHTGGTLSLSDGTVQTALPPFFRVRMTLSPEPASRIRQELWLPDEWNGLFLGTGNGGRAANISYGALVSYLRQGYAVANTDLGTSRGQPRSEVEREAVAHDFGWRATHLMTVIGQELTALAYGEAPRLRYFRGGSTGGQQALSEAQRFPEDYDGILCGAPANDRVNLHTYFTWGYVHARDENRRPLFDRSICRRVRNAALSYCGAEKDGFIPHPPTDPDALDGFLARLPRDLPDLTGQQLAALAAIYRGPVNPRTGERIYCGVPLGAELSPRGHASLSETGCPDFYPTQWALGADADPFAFDFDRDHARVRELLSDDLDAVNPDLSAFAARGGRILIASGAADAIVPFPPAEEYCRRIPGASSFLRFYLAPARDHSVAGLGAGELCSPDGRAPFDLLRDWREKGILPGALLSPVPRAVFPL